MTTRKYTSRSQQTTLTGSVTSGALVIPVVSATTLLGGATVSAGQTFTVVIDPDTALEEVVDITAVSANNLTITRAIDGSSAQDHSAGAVVRHMIIGRDLREANLHIEASTYYNDGINPTKSLHGLGSTDGAVVGSSQTATLTNKTIDATSNTITNIADTNIKSGAAIAPAKIAGVAVTQADTGTVTSTMILDGTILNADINAAAAIAATKIAGIAVTQADTGTVTSAMIADGTIVNADISPTAAIANSKLATNPLDRANHINTQLASTISNFDTQVRTSRLDQMAAPTASVAMNAQKITGLADPTLIQDAATKNYVDGKINTLVNGAPVTLDQLNELAAAINNDPNFSTTLNTALGTKLPLAGGAMTGAIAMGTNKITGLGDPTLAQDAVTLNYVTTLYGSTAAAATSATSAAASATAAATSATSAAASATAAATSATSSAASATAAAGSATAAAASATAAATSATSAATQATNAAASATAAATSATSAAASATAAAGSATAASGSATAAANSAATASTQASNASASATAAALSATNAAASATAAAASATAAATSASSASTYATNALASQTAAATSATSAAASATAAATSATSSLTSATSSTTTYNVYKTWYLGTFSSAPSLDNQGNPLIVGATYFNSGTNVMYVWSGTSWNAISSATSYSAPTLGSTTINSGTTYSTITGLNLTNATVTADPTTNLGIASKQYVDSIAAGLNAHDAVSAATTSAITATYTAGSAGADGGTGVGAYLTVTATGALVIDGYTTALNDRVLIKDQATATQNGIYKVTTAGTTGVSAVLTRATDFDNHIAGQVYAGDTVFITSGSTNINQGWVMNSIGTSTTPVKGIKIGTDNISWTQYTGVGTITPGTGILKSGNTLSIDTSVVDTLTGANTLTNKTLTTPVINGATLTGTVTSSATVTGGTANNLTLTGTLTANASAGTNGYYLQSTGTGVTWAAVAGYSAPTIGTTSIGSGATVATINGMTKIQAAAHTQLDGNGFEMDHLLMTLMGAI